MTLSFSTVFAGAGTLDMLSRLEGIETPAAKRHRYGWSEALDMLSRLKGIETALTATLRNFLAAPLDMLSRLKGIETFGGENLR